MTTEKDGAPVILKDGIRIFTGHLLSPVFVYQEVVYRLNLDDTFIIFSVSQVWLASFMLTEFKEKGYVIIGFSKSGDEYSFLLEKKGN